MNTSVPNASDSLPVRAERLAVSALLALAAALRLPALFDAFWLDEIWSRDFVFSLPSVWRLFAGPHLDNHHPLTGLFVYLAGPAVPWWIYRLPSLGAGLGAAAAAWALGRRESRATGLVSLGLFAVSFPMIVYSTEARGYGLLIFLALLAYRLADRVLDRNRWPALIGFWVAVALGFFSHLAFAHVWLALVLWPAWHWARRHRRWRAVAGELLKLHGLPMVFLALFYFFGIRHMELGGGPHRALVDVLAATASLALGLPEAGPWGWAGLAICLGFLIVGLHPLVRRGSDRWLFYLTAIVLGPAVSLAFMERGLLFERYFLVSVAFLLLLTGQALGQAWERRGAPRLFAILILSLFLLGNLLRLSPFYQFGRGQYAQALEYIVENSPGQSVTIGSDHDFRNATTLSFYARRLPPGKRLIYCEQGRWPAAGPQWFIRHSLQPLSMPEPALDIDGRVYRLQRHFPHAGPSGFDWYLYRR